MSAPPIGMIHRKTKRSGATTVKHPSACLGEIAINEAGDERNGEKIRIGSRSACRHGAVHLEGDPEPEKVTAPMARQPSSTR